VAIPRVRDHIMYCRDERRELGDEAIQIIGVIKTFLHVQNVWVRCSDEPEGLPNRWYIARIAADPWFIKLEKPNTWLGERTADRCEAPRLHDGYLGVLRKSIREAHGVFRETEMKQCDSDTRCPFPLNLSALHGGWFGADQ
jgi:hypothetical protein